MSPIDEYDSFGPVFTGEGTALPWIFTLIAAILFIGFLARVIMHENHAYQEMAKGEPIEPGPAVEGEPPVY